MLTVVREGNGKVEAEGVAWSGVRGLFARSSTGSTQVSTPLLVSNVESFLPSRHQLEPTFRMARTIVKDVATISAVELMPRTIPRESARIKGHIHQLVPPRIDVSCAFAVLSICPCGDRWLFFAAD